MTQIQDTSAKSKPGSRCFMGCFGFSREKVSQDMDHTVKTGSLKKKIRWISCSKFVIKTVPVDAPVSEKLNRSRELQSLKSLNHFSSKKHKQATGINPDNIPATGPDQTVNNKAHKKRSEIEEECIVFENRELGHSMGEDDTSWQRTPSQRKDNKRTGSSNPGSPPINKNVSKKTTTSLPHSESLPPKRNKHKVVSGGGDNNVIRETDGKFDPIFGMSIVMVTLLMMLLWGKLCAILCTSAWFFMVPRLRRAMDSNVIVENRSNSGEPDLNSEEYKKKVVLEGLLKRNRRNVIRIL